MGLTRAVTQAATHHLVVVEHEHTNRHGFVQWRPPRARQGRPGNRRKHEAGQLLVSPRGLAYTLVNRRDIPGIRLGRRIVVPRQALDQLLDARDAAA
jgi:hypothetical protein